MGAERRTYAPQIESEVLDILRTMRDHADSLDLGADIESTPSVCRALLNSSYELIEGSYCHIRHLNFLALHILLRSLVEYTVDLLYLSSVNDLIVNRWFYRFGILIRYWGREKFASERLKKEIAQCEVDYRKWASTGFDSMLEKWTRMGKLPAPDDPTYSLKLDKAIRDTFRSHWSGMDRVKRIKIVEDIDNSIVKELNSLNKAFDLYSKYTHPTPYGFHSWQSAKIEGEGVRFENWDDPENDERNILLFIILLNYGFRKALPTDMSKQFKDRFWGLVEISKNIQPFIMKHIGKQM